MSELTNNCGCGQCLVCGAFQKHALQRLADKVRKGRVKFDDGTTGEVDDLTREQFFSDPQECPVCGEAGHDAVVCQILRKPAKREDGEHLGEVAREERSA